MGAWRGKRVSMLDVLGGGLLVLLDLGRPACGLYAMVAGASMLAARLPADHSPCPSTSPLSPPATPCLCCAAMGPGSGASGTAMSPSSPRRAPPPIASGQSAVLRALAEQTQRTVAEQARLQPAPPPPAGGAGARRGGGMPAGLGGGGLGGLGGLGDLSGLGALGGLLGGGGGGEGGFDMAAMAAAAAAGGGEAGGGAGGGQMNMILETVMQHLLSKEVLYTPMTVSAGVGVCRVGAMGCAQGSLSLTHTQNTPSHVRAHAYIIDSPTPAPTLPIMPTHLASSAPTSPLRTFVPSTPPGWPPTAPRWRPRSVSATRRSTLQSARCARPMRTSLTTTPRSWGCCSRCVFGVRVEVSSGKRIAIHECVDDTTVQHCWVAAVCAV